MNKKVAQLLTLGEMEHINRWPDPICDYSHFGFTDADAQDLIALVRDTTLHEDVEVWAPLHAWRVLGHLRSVDAIQPIIDQFDTLKNDDWAFTELGEVLGMIGQPAITPLSVYFFNSDDVDVYSRVMAVDSLSQVAQQHPEHRGQVLNIFKKYMHNPEKDHSDLNGLLIASLIKLQATELIDEIRQMFAWNCVDIGIPGDLEDVEIGMGLRVKRATPKPNYNQFLQLDKNVGGFEDDKSDHQSEAHLADQFYHHIDDILIKYGTEESLLDVASLDGFFAAIACSPNLIRPSQWMPQIWGGEDFLPEWESLDEFKNFSEHVILFYNNSLNEFQSGNIQPMFHEYEDNDEVYLSVDDWCEGFMRGVHLWMSPEYQCDSLVQECLEPIGLFVLEEDTTDKVTGLSSSEIKAEQLKIVPAVKRLYHYFAKHRSRTPLVETFVHDHPKVGRNDPCPCGSGKKFKKCCLH